MTVNRMIDGDPGAQKWFSIGLQIAKTFDLEEGRSNGCHDIWPCAGEGFGVHIATGLFYVTDAEPVTCWKLRIT